MTSRRLLVEAFVTSERRLLGMVLLVGVGGGLISAAFVGTIHVLQRGLWPTHTGDVAHLFILIGVGIGVAMLTRILGNPGDVELMVNNIHIMGGPQDVSDLRSLIPVALLCISSGGGMGPEAPLVQTTGSLGAWLSGRWRLSLEDTRILTITGMPAGFTVLFGAPLGSAIFALEILHRRGLEYHEALLPAILGSLGGYGVYVAITRVGLAPVWRFPSLAAIRGVDLLWALAAGALGALLSVIFTYLSAALLWGFRRVPTMARPVIGGAVLGALAFWSPYALTFGEAQINPLTTHKALVSVMIVAILAKLCGTAVTLSSGWRGGFIIPMFFIGVASGRLFHILVPSTNEVVMMAAFMVAINVGVTKTPLGSTLVVTEMAGLLLLPTTLIAAVTALFLTSEVGLIHTQLPPSPPGISSLFRTGGQGRWADARPAPAAPGGQGHRVRGATNHRRDRRSLKLRHHSAVELVDRAVAAELLVRSADPYDARVQRLVLTPRGRRNWPGCQRRTDRSSAASRRRCHWSE